MCTESFLIYCLWIDVFTEWLSLWIDVFTEWISLWIDVFTEWNSLWIDVFTEWLSLWIDVLTFTEWNSLWIDVFTEWLSLWIDLFTEWYSLWIDVFTEWLSLWIDLFTEWYSLWIDVFTEWLSLWIDLFTEWYSLWIDVFIEWLSLWIDLFTEWLSLWIDTSIEWYSLWIDVFIEWLTLWIDVLWIDTSTEWLSLWINVFIEWLSVWIDVFIEWLSLWIDVFIHWLILWIDVFIESLSIWINVFTEWLSVWIDVFIEWLRLWIDNKEENVILEQLIPELENAIHGRNDSDAYTDPQGSVIGLAIARKLAQDGAKVVVSSRKQVNVEKAVQNLKSENLEVTGVVCHVGKSQDRTNLIQTALTEYGGVDILVSNAAQNPFFGNILDVKRGGGSIVIVSSIGGYNPSNVIGPYSVSKTALLGLTKALVHQLSPLNIRVNGIAPGLIKTRFSEAIWRTDEAKKLSESMIPIRRIGEPQECAGIVAFLVSDEASYINGENIIVAGGIPARLTADERVISVKEVEKGKFCDKLDFIYRTN
ncbi:hypothetical protein KUTeg_014533 [Tegillarca granosa]|uniref:Dehydrogenase/reductase SDR family member 4 n=1 Tax=Tegillarca granosa TaxID=220873 RepID=A0ABQ9EW00_TEGGR|nr:hypothetical protein KUTeg_014533 [Tegillarca granosa]